MDQILRGYRLNDPTWFYLSFLLILAVYFKFSRFWSIRNLDLALLLLISPGLLLVRNDDAAVADFGYAWMFLAAALLLVRALADGLITRRPRLEQNMNAAGMAFLCAATFLFLTTKLLTELPPASTVESVRRAHQLLGGEGESPKLVEDSELVDSAPAGPGSSLLAAPFVFLAGEAAGALSVAAPDQLGMTFVPLDRGRPVRKSTILIHARTGWPRSNGVMCARSIALVCMLGLLMACRTPPKLPAIDLSEAGWQVRQGQAVWKPNKNAPELSGELVYASHPDGRFLLQFLKTPITLVEAQGDKEAWQISFPPQGQTIGGSRAHLPSQRLGWMYLAQALQAQALPGDWTFTSKPDGWKLGNARTGEVIEGYLRP